jgi:hypothetical protein
MDGTPSRCRCRTQAATNVFPAPILREHGMWVSDASSPPPLLLAKSRRVGRPETRRVLWDDEQQPEPTPTLRSLSTPSSSLSAGVPLLSQRYWR